MSDKLEDQLRRDVRKLLDEATLKAGLSEQAGCEIAESVCADLTGEYADRLGELEVESED